jgi:hypothetical protein
MHMFGRGARSGAVISATVALAACSAVGAAGATAHLRHQERPARLRASPGWRIVSTAHFGEPGNASGLSAILALSRTDAWAFGGTNPGGSSSPVAEHWNGKRWQASPLPGGLRDFIVAASAVSPRDIWAVSFLGGYVLHWNGRSWHVARRWKADSQATGITAISPSDVWVFGAGQIPGRSLRTWNFNGRTWRQVRGPAGAIYRASAIGPRDIWAVAPGLDGGSVLHFNGTSWHRVRTGSALAKVDLTDVLAVSRHDIWVAGQTSRGRVILAHRTGSRWRRYEAPGHAEQPRLAAGRRGGVWITAMTVTSQQTAARILHFCAGTWRSMTIRHGQGNSVSGMATIPGSRALWASGGFLTRAGGDVVIWLYLPDRQGQRRSDAASDADPD